MRTRLGASYLSLTLGLAFAVYAHMQADGQESSPHEKGKRVTLTGCLRAGTQHDTYILDNVSTSQRRSNEAHEAPKELARTETSYKLIPEGNVNLTEHLGHKVEVAGMWVHKESSMEHSTSKASSGSYSESSETRELRVSSIRHLSTTCP